MHVRALILACFFATAATAIEIPRFFAGVNYRLTTQWQGEGKALSGDVYGRRVALSPTGGTAAQLWRITSAGNGYYRITPLYNDRYSLDIENSGAQNKPVLGNTGNYSGQMWKITPVGNGYHRLTTMWQGTGKALDILNDGKNDQPRLVPAGNYSGQMWKISMPTEGVASFNLANRSSSAIAYTVRSKTTLTDRLSPGQSRNYTVSYAVPGGVHVEWRPSANSACSYSVWNGGSFWFPGSADLKSSGAASPMGVTNSCSHEIIATPAPVKNRATVTIKNTTGTSIPATIEGFNGGQQTVIDRNTTKVYVAVTTQNRKPTIKFYDTFDLDDGATYTIGLAPAQYNKNGGMTKPASWYPVRQ